MRLWQRLAVGAGIGAAATGCDPMVTLYARQPLRPAPPTDCLASALAASPDLAWVSRARHDVGGAESFAVSLREPTPLGGLRDATIARAARSDSATSLTMRFAWGGTFRHPPAAEERAVVAVAGRIFAQVRAACAPASPSVFECDYGDGKSAKSCAPAT